MGKLTSQNFRFKFYHQLDEIYHQFLDELAQAELPDHATGRIAQAVMRSRLEGLKQLVEESEMEAYYEQYPQDRNN